MCVGVGVSDQTAAASAGRGRRSDGGSARSRAGLTEAQSCGSLEASRAHSSSVGKVASAESRQCPPGALAGALDLTRMSTAAVSSVRKKACVVAVSSQSSSVTRSCMCLP